MKRMTALVLCCVMLGGCAKEAVETTAVISSVVVTEPSLTPETTVPEVTVPETSAPEHFLTLYAPNEDATGFIYASWEVPEVNAETICGALIQTGVLNEDAAFNSLTIQTGQVSLDVNDAFARQLMSYGTAGEYMMMGSVVNTLLGAYGAETLTITMEGGILESGHVIYDFPLEFYENQSAEPLNNLPPMVMVNGEIYLDTGIESAITSRCGMMDGIIESQVDSWQRPAENNQSNFGVGFGYQYGSEPGTIEVLIGKTWWIYAVEKIG